MRSLALLCLALAVPSPSRAERLFVSCEDDGAIAVIDTASASLVATWPAGKRPRGLRLGPGGARLYVALSGTAKSGPGIDDAEVPPPDRSADGIGEFDALTGELLRMLPGGQDPETFDISADGRTLFVANEDTARASIVDAARGRLRGAVSVGGEPEGVRLRPDGRVVYVTSEADGQVVAIDTRARRVRARIPTPLKPRGVVFSPDGRRAFVSSESGARVTVVDALHHRVLSTIPIPNDGVNSPLGARPVGLALTRDGGTLFVANGRGGTVSVVDTRLGRVVRTVGNVGARPWGLALSGDEHTLYSANGPSDDVSVIDVASGKVREKIRVCGGPWGLALGGG